VLILIDGYNVIAPAAPPGRRAVDARVRSSGAAAPLAAHWLHAERMRLLHRLAEHLDPELAGKTHVIFDSAAGNRHGPDVLRIHGIHVRFAVSHDEADDLIEELIAAHHSPKRLTVVSSDHRLQVAARRAGAKAFDAQPWLDALLDGRVMLAIAWPPRGRKTQAQVRQHDRHKPEQVDPGDVEQWLRAFEISADEQAHLPVEPPRSGGKPARPASAVQPPQSLGQGRGQGRAEDRSTKPSSAPPARAQPQRSRPPANQRAKPSSRNAPPPLKELPPDYNPFPHGYGEDLLGDAAAE